ncbi:MAG: NYN domain-containing protein [Burkholderiales bacterium]|nr:NYN domain-containing protein [Burkholderiales bacterium]
MSETTNPPARHVALLIDADNVSIDVVEQAVAQLLAEHGALHVRRAYGTAEHVAKHQAAFKRLGIRPMVNLAAGKNSTDIALAVDAIDLMIAERPDVIAIASSDSDFAPLVTRLREKGCRVVGLGQAGKTGDETQAVYDAYSVLTHRKGAAGTPAKKAKAAAHKSAKPAPKSAAESDAKPAAKDGAKDAAKAAGGAAAPAAKKAAPSRRGAAAKSAADVPTSPSPAGRADPGDRLARILAALPELERGETVELRVAAERLREAGLIGRNGSSTKAFGGFPDRFELLPAKNPNKVRLRG